MSDYQVYYGYDHDIPSDRPSCSWLSIHNRYCCAQMIIVPAVDDQLLQFLRQCVRQDIPYITTHYIEELIREYQAGNRTIITGDFRYIVDVLPKSDEMH